MADDSAPNQAQDEILPLPDKFFDKVLPRIDDLSQLKLILLLLRRLRRDRRVLRHDELLQDEALRATTASGDDIDAALRKLLQLGALLEAKMESEGETAPFIILNNGAGRRIRQGLESGTWQPGDETPAVQTKSNVIRAYEENIGAVTPHIADVIRDAERDFPEHMIVEAIGYAAERNIRNWRYISKMLENRQKEGRGSEKTGRPLERRKQYIAGEWQSQIRR